MLLVLLLDDPLWPWLLFAAIPLAITIGSLWVIVRGVRFLRSGEKRKGVEWLIAGIGWLGYVTWCLVGGHSIWSGN